jgi:hypothetical protein
MKMDIDRHSPRLMPNNCKNLNPRYFSLPSTFKVHLGPLNSVKKSAKSKNTVGGGMMVYSSFCGFFYT